MTLNDIDKIYCICLYENLDRLNNAKKIQNQFNLSKFEIKYATKHNYYNDIYKNLNFDFAGQLGASISHYEAISQAYYLNYNYVLVCEDDITFDYNEVNYFLNNVPNDFNIIQCYALDIQLPKSITTTKEDLENKYNNGLLWHKVDNKSTRFGAVFYILDRIGMKYYLDCQKEYFRIADYPFLISYNYNVNHYIPTKKIISEIGVKSTVSNY